MKERVNVTVDVDLLKQIDEIAKKLSQSRSSFMCLAAATYIQQSDTVNMLPKLIDAYNKQGQKEQEESK